MVNSCCSHHGLKSMIGVVTGVLFFGCVLLVGIVCLMLMGERK